MITLRPVTLTDYNTLEEIEKKNRSFHEGILLDMVLINKPMFNTSKCKHMAIVDDAGEIQGILCLKAITTKNIYIELLYIRHDKRAAGTGTAVINYLLKQNISKLTAHGFTTAAEEFFFNRGFTGEPGYTLTLKKNLHGKDTNPHSKQLSN